MDWSTEIDNVELPNGRTVNVCAPHRMVTCHKCCLDFSFELSDDDEGELERLERMLADGSDGRSDEHNDTDEDVVFGQDFHYSCYSSVPRDVSVAQVANSQSSRSAGNAPKSFRAAYVEDVDDDESDESDDFPPAAFKKPAKAASMPAKAASTPAEIDLESFVLETSPSQRTHEKTKHSGTVFPSKFGQQKKTPLSPEDLFPTGRSVRAMPHVTRFMNRYDTTECLIYTDGACFNNGAPNARGGCAFIFKPTSTNESGSVAFKLEDRGPDDKVYRHTSNRAELRAVIAALRFRAWHGEGFKSIVIATDSTYVANRATDWVRSWIKNGWRLSTGEPVKNRDLWEALLLDVERLHDRGTAVRFWKIPRKFNHLADRAAKGAASILKPRENFADILGFLV